MRTFGMDPEGFFTEENLVLPARIVFERIGINTERIFTPAGDLYVDGAAIEFQPKPSTKIGIVIANMRDLLLEASKIADSAGTTLEIVPELGIDLSWCKQDPSLAVFGCDPDLSAYGETCRPATIDAGAHPYRYAGCHLHFGDDNRTVYDTKRTMVRAIKALDRTVGLAGMIMGQNTDARRRGIYGRPGVYRQQPWGVEYRTPSNGIMLEPETLEFILNLANTTLDHETEACSAVPDRLVIAALRGDDLDFARRIYQLVMSELGLSPDISLPASDWKSHWEVT